ncbi:expressed unknown protein [Seminavis robusta]|uniref:Uncharacterized protein n=1 Tax=Seminavis robusta TaxID=568900 RepID=A0A9N8EJW3_9STRA|nr:expressed unknown protein [Seminavis robusta]|eukprot:Sro1196_g251470.1 n/a (724) ;mRNA; f:12188-14359
MVEVVKKAASTAMLKLDALSPPSTADKGLHGDETEELLRGAFDELEKERERRIQLEAKLRSLQENPPSSPSQLQEKPTERKSRRRSSTKSEATAKAAPKQEEPAAIPPKQYAAMQQELEGYRQIVNAMTQERPAIAAAMQANEARRSAAKMGRPMPLQNPTLPLHVCRLMEVCPWEAKAQEHAFSTEEIMEWQVYNIKQQKWCTELNQLPSFFQALPILKATTNFVQEVPQPSESLRQPGRDRSLLFFLAGCETMGNGTGTSASLTAPPEKCVLTNAGISRVVQLANGFPLPHDGGTWQWIGGWRIEKRVIVFAGDGLDNRPQTLDCDGDGWSYAMDASDFLKENPELHCFEQPGMVEDKLTLEKTSFLSGNKVVRHLVPIRKIRRRKWTRRRVLVDYPHASEQSKHFLRLLAQNASLTFAANKISDQLVETKMKLTDMKLKTFQNEEETKAKVSQLKQEIKLKEEAIVKLKQQKLVEKKTTGNGTTQKPSSKGQTTTANKETTVEMDKDYDSAKKDVDEAPKEMKEKELDCTQNEDSRQGKDLHSMLSQWISPNSKVTVISNDQMAECSDTENPVSGDSSTASAPAALEEEPVGETQQQADEGKETVAEDNADDSISRSRRNSVSSTSSQMSFDWKKLGRETMEKLKQGQAAAANGPLLWLTPKDKDSSGSERGESTPRSTSPTAGSEASMEPCQSDDSDATGWSQPSNVAGPPPPQMTVGA